MAYNLEQDINNIDAPVRAYQESEYNPFDAPIPGQSLTKEPGNAAYEHPPKIARVEEAMGYVWDKLSEEKNFKRTVALLRFGMPVEALTKVITFSGFLEGKWSVDVAKMLEPTVGQMIATLGSTSKVPMKISLNDESDSEFFSTMASNELEVDKTKDKVKKDKMAMMPEIKKPTGLMARGVA